MIALLCPSCTLYICPFLKLIKLSEKGGCFSFSFKLVPELVPTAVRRHRPLSSLARPGFGSPRKARPTPGTRAAVGRLTRRFFLARFPARAAHAPPCRRRKLPYPVPVASSSPLGCVSGLTSRFRQAVWSALVCFPLLCVRVCCLALKWPPLDLSFAFPGPQPSPLPS